MSLWAYNAPANKFKWANCEQKMTQLSLTMSNLSIGLKVFPANFCFSSLLPRWRDMREPRHHSSIFWPSHCHQHYLPWIHQNEPHFIICSFSCKSTKKPQNSKYSLPFSKSLMSTCLVFFTFPIGLQFLISVHIHCVLRISQFCISSNSWMNILFPSAH